MQPFDVEYYGDDTRWFVATVVDSTPPYGLEGRIKISIHGIHSSSVNDIPHKDLPWAQVMMPGNVGSSSGRGNVPRINPGSLVMGLFLDGGGSQLPMVLGSIHRTELPTQNQIRDVLVPSERIPEDQREAQALRYFIDLGYRPHIVATLVGFIDHWTEASYSPITEREGYFGLCGWKVDSNRYVSLRAFTDTFSPKYDHRSFEGQLAFIAHELQTTQTTAMGALMATKAIESMEQPYRVNCRLTRGNGSAAAFITHYLNKKLFQDVKSDLNLIERKSIAKLTLINERN